MTGGGLHRDIPKYTAAFVDFCLPGILPLSGISGAENVGTLLGGGEITVQDGGGAYPVHFFGDCRDCQRRLKLRGGGTV